MLAAPFRTPRRRPARLATEALQERAPGAEIMSHAIILLAHGDIGNLREAGSFRDVPASTLPRFPGDFKWKPEG